MSRHRGARLSAGLRAPRGLKAVFPLTPAQLRLLRRVHLGQLYSVYTAAKGFTTFGLREGDLKPWNTLLTRMGLLRVDPTIPHTRPRRWLLTRIGLRELRAAGLLDTIDSRPGHVTSASVPGTGPQPRPQEGLVITRNLGETDAHYAARLADIKRRRVPRAVNRARGLLAADSLAGARSALAVLTVAADQAPADRAKAVSAR